MPKKSQDNLWADAVRSLMGRLKATIKGESMPILTYWHLETSLGLLTLCLADDDALSLYSRFADPQRAVATVRCNPYSGKWNWHLQGEINDAIATIEADLRAIL